MFSGDFVRLTSSNTFKQSDGMHVDDWTDAELLLLLEGIEMYDDDFNAVAEHVGTRTREQCVAQFLQLPIEDEYSQQPTSQDDLGLLQYARVPFEKTDNPVMSVVAFLAGAFGPVAAVAAAATQAGLSELTESIKRKTAARKQPPAVTKEEEDEPGAIVSGESPEPIVVEDTETNGHQTTRKPSPAFPRSSIGRAAAIALASASVKAKALASHEDDQIRSLMAKITVAQRTKLELKLEQFEALEELVEEERRSLEEARQALHRERAHIASQLAELRATVMQPRAMGVPPQPNLDMQFHALTTSDVMKASEVTMQPGEHVDCSNLTALS
jgi:SWI/SNF related-matrix-associated actin-dependent regulator of chromatin subfamily C